jgi:hypothetical protein
VDVDGDGEEGGAAGEGVCAQGGGVEEVVVSVFWLVGGVEGVGRDGLGFVDFKPAMCGCEVLGWVGCGTGAGDGEVCWDGEGRGYEREEGVNECGGIEPAHGCRISSRND